MSALVILIVAAASLGLFLVAQQRWRGAFLAALYLLVIEGALRKWVFSTGQEYVYFAKDALLLGVYVRLIRDGKLDFRAIQRAFGNAASIFLLLSSAWLTVQCANPSGGGLAVSLFGLKSYLFAVPMAVVVPHIFPDRQSLMRFFWIYGALILPTGFIATVQFVSPADAWINRYAWSGEAGRVATFTTGQVRVTSTFSYITPYSTYLSVMAPHLVSLLGSARVRWRQVLLLAAMGMLGANLLMSGSRWPVFASMGGALLVALSIPWLRARRAVQLFLRAALAGLVLYLVVTAVYPKSLEAFSQRVAETSDVEGRMQDILLAFVPLADWGGLPVNWLGEGTGTAHQAARHLNPMLGEDLPEGEFARIGMELGVVGYLLLWLFRVALLLRVGASALRIHDPELRPIAVAAIVVMLLNFPGGYVYSPTTQMLVYFLAGVPATIATLTRAPQPAAG